MSRPSFRQLLRARWNRGARLCVGLDPQIEKIDRYVPHPNTPVEAHIEFVWQFLKSIIDATHTHVLAYKPNIAFYEAFGFRGYELLKRVVDYIHKIAPDIPIIVDAKRGDIGKTNEGYVKALFDWYNFDACTVSPFLGLGALDPFLVRRDKTSIVLCRTSNPEAPEFQDRRVRTSLKESASYKVFIFPFHGRVYTGLKARILAATIGEKMYRYVARRIAARDEGQCACVVGATYPQELEEIRAIVGPAMPILMPGIGTQGGDLAAAVLAGLSNNAEPGSVIINSSSGVIHKDKRRPANAALDEILRITDEIKKAEHNLLAK